MDLHHRYTGRLHSIAVAFFIIWLAFSLSAYYLVQNAYLQPTLEALSSGAITWRPLSLSLTAVWRTLLDLLTAVWIIFIALGTGAWLLERLSLNNLSRLETLLFGLGLGFGALGLLTLALGLVGLLQPTVFYIITIILTLLTGRKSLSLLRPLALKRPHPLITLYLALSIGLALTLALLPPTSWDGLFYHLTGPKLYLAAGQIQPGIDIPHLNFPSLFQMIFMMAMALRGDVTAQLLHFFFHFMLAGIVYATAREHLGVRNGWLAVLFLYAMPMVLALAVQTYNDLALAFYTAVALYAFLKSNESANLRVASTSIRWLFLSGLFSGLAMSLKYTSFVGPLVLAGLIVWRYRQSVRQSLRPLLMFGLPAALVAAPWYVKNLLFTGNPVYPFLFGGHFWDAFRSQAYAEPGTGIGFDGLALLRLPFDLTLGIGDASQDGPTGPFFLIFIPLLIAYTFIRMDRKLPSAFKIILTLALAFYLFWLLGVINSAALRQSRLLLPCFVILCPLLAWILEDLARFNQRHFSLQRFLTMIITLVLGASLLIQLLYWLPHQPWTYLLGHETRTENLRHRLGSHYAAMEAINGRLPADAVIVLLWEPRSYYCERDCRPDSILDKFGHLQYLHGNAPNIATAWRRERITHVLLWRDGLDFMLTSPTLSSERLPDTAVLEQLQRDHFNLITQVAGYELYALTGKGE